MKLPTLYSPTCGELSVDECNARTATLTAELAKIYSLVAPHGCDLPNGIWETAQAVSDLIARAEIAENWSDHHAAHADDLIAENVKLRADLERFTGHGLLDCHMINSENTKQFQQMSTTPRTTEAHRELVREMALQGQYLNRSIEHYAQLLADSEARAVACFAHELATEKDNRNHLIEKGAKIETELSCLRAEIERWRDSKNRIRAEMESQAQRAEQLKYLWTEFITLMEITEESDSGNAFNPNKISSCRAMDGKRLSEILIEARQIIFKQ